VIDNVPFRKAPSIQEAIEAVGVTLRYLLPYSPDVSPIELVFPPYEKHPAQTAERTIDASTEASARSLERSSHSHVSSTLVMQAVNCLTGKCCKSRRSGMWRRFPNQGTGFPST
jgi:hypothetical protein